jgi:hypothetical protein
MSNNNKNNMLNTCEICDSEMRKQVEIKYTTKDCKLCKNSFSMSPCLNCNFQITYKCKTCN